MNSIFLGGFLFMENKDSNIDGFVNSGSIVLPEKESKNDENVEKLPFAYAEVVRLMKENLDSDKMIRERVKVEMNKFLGEILRNICKQLNEYPYTTVDYEMFKECIYPYSNIKRINQEKERILLHLEAIKSDCTALQSDVESTLKLTDKKDDEPNLFDFSKKEDIE